MKILYAVSEAFPFAKDGGLGDVAYAFPRELKKLGADIRLVMPLYDIIPKRYRDSMELVTNFMLELSFQKLYCGLYRLELDGIICYFIENDIYFRRGKLYGCRDDDARYAFFSRAVVECLRVPDWVPDVVHCNDWQTALVPFYLRDEKLKHRRFPDVKTVFTIHNVEYQGDFSYHSLTDVFGLSGSLFSQGTLELGGDVNLMKGAVLLADCVTTVSPSYGEELSNRNASGALSEVLAKHRIVGIRNGIHENMRPSEAPCIHHPYTAESLDVRRENKLWMQERNGLVVDGEAPVFGCVSRLLPRKGFDLILEVMPAFLEQGAELVISGDGSKAIRQQLQQLKERYPEQVALLDFAENNNVEVLSSCDIFLMPSEVEPCGTAQLQAMRYGMIPVVHATGGLKDTVVPYDRETGEGYGFSFDDYSPDAFRDAVSDAVAVYEDKTLWEMLQKRCMAQDFSWAQPAKEYFDLYQSI